jgi:hypothetical protein
MRIALTTLVSAASLCTLATAASAQDYPTIPSTTGAPPYSYHHTGPQPAAVGSCEIIAGNRVCSAGPAGYGYNNTWGPVGAVVDAPFVLAAAPFGAMGGFPAAGSAPTYAPATGALPYSYESHLPPQPGASGYCDIVSGNRVCFP